MKVEVYDCEDGSITVLTEDDPNKSFLIGENAIFLRAIESESWEDCMKKHHEIMGWEPYKPME
jgi:hypothetical protein